MEYEYAIIYTDISPDGFIEDDELIYTKLSHAKKVIEKRIFWRMANIIVKRLVNSEGETVRYVQKVWVYKNNRWYSTRKVKRYNLWLLEE